ncbi:MAG: uracil-DNA glycosylase [Legionellaceae bacterium]|nr:uracil-DNA glycosylase [Legionellaceae bacterium]
MQDEWIKNTHPQWHPLLQKALATIEPAYWRELKGAPHWLPGFERMLAAFSLPLQDTRFILLGESPYPRAASANGYAFWDAAVGDLWSAKGMSSAVNRATSLRNFIKMLLHAQGALRDDFSQEAIARLDKSGFWQDGSAFFQGMLRRGFLLLNASLVFRRQQVARDTRIWLPFMQSMLQQLAQQRPDITLILFGRLAEKVADFTALPCLIAEHPYNVSFIQNPKVLHFFKPLDLLTAYEEHINR